MHDMESDNLSAESIKERLKTSYFGKEVIYLPAITSTNRVAKEAAQKEMQEGTLVITDHQTEGRGRLDRTWWSPPGKDLLFSLIFRPVVTITQTFRLTVVSSLAIAEAIRQETELETLIKWPNDIFIKGKKIAGILSEVSGTSERLEYVIVGIGINVNSNPAVYPEIHDSATSLRRELRQDFPRLELLAAVLKRIETYYQRLQEGDFSSLKNRWDALSIITNKSVSVKSMGSAYEGIAESIDDDGVLTLRDHTGTRWRIVCADVSLSLL
jgi:BirA family biotin operon repressor/biotin-[acetyl-CoA-carboxylase] ligase